MTPFSGDEIYEPMPSPPPPRAEPVTVPPRRSFAPRRPGAARTFYRPSPGASCDCGCIRRS